ncbi:serine hydrolase domain-containing protein [Geodermatophilus sp. URMC 61]|uniref:serine hydrolase domain-containing protein n=1 Tax=Geodermatophilus sp. URMC 61 TaxID=3423411 RepID=UPI00406CEE13
MLASLAATTVTGPAAVAQPPGVDAARLTGYLEAALRSTRLPGVAAAVVEGDGTAVVAGVGDDGRGGAVTSRTRFRVASLSKSFTAVAVLQLVEDRRIDLDSPVQAYLPEFGPEPAAVAARVTVRHLLNQTSGLTDGGYPGIVDDGAADLQRRVALLRTARLSGEPGTRFHYSDLNYQVLGRLVEVVSGVPLGTHLDARVFGPLGMSDTVSVTTAAAGSHLPGLARGHVLVFGCPVARQELDGLLAGSGGVITTAGDMARWLGFQTTGRTPDGRVLLSPALLRLSHTPPDGVSGGYAMGWQVVRGPSGTGPAMLEHTGVLSTFSAQQVLLPGADVGFALLYDGNSALADTAAVERGLVALLTGAPAPGVRSTALTAGLLAGALLATVVAVVRGLVRGPAWAARRGRRRWGTAARFVPALLPAVLLGCLPAVLRAGIGRTFTSWQLALAMPDVAILLVVAAIGGLAVATVRVCALVRRPLRAGGVRTAARGTAERTTCSAPPSSRSTSRWAGRTSGWVPGRPRRCDRSTGRGGRGRARGEAGGVIEGRTEPEVAPPPEDVGPRPVGRDDVGRLRHPAVLIAPSCRRRRRCPPV